MELKAIHNVLKPSQVGDEQTLIFNLEDGFAWLKTVGDNNWWCHATTDVEAETNARLAGYDPQAIVYVGISRPTCEKTCSPALSI